MRIRLERDGKVFEFEDESDVRAIHFLKQGIDLLFPEIMEQRIFNELHPHPQKVPK